MKDGFEYKRADLNTRLWIIWITFTSTLRQWLYFFVEFLLHITGMIVNILIFYYIAIFVNVGQLEAYGGDFASFIVLGIIFNSFLSATMNSYYNALCRGFWNTSLEFFATSPVGVISYTMGITLYEYFKAAISITLYLLLGVFVFNISPSAPNYALTLLLLVLGVISVSGLGLISASTFTLLNCRRWGNPVQWLTGFIIALTSGVYFPVEWLPEWARGISLLLPQTYVYRSARLALLKGATLNNPIVRGDFYALTLFCIILIPLGLLFFKAGIRKAEREGSFSRWV